MCALRCDVVFSGDRVAVKFSPGTDCQKRTSATIFQLSNMPGQGRLLQFPSVFMQGCRQLYRILIHIGIRRRPFGQCFHASSERGCANEACNGIIKAYKNAPGD
ncbi:hypothetical protein THS27_17765 [Thalassospira sp. MCCC 1A01428]|nr:hypothetical protein THS27_17765 [Thalassospira sp. MCCC 1A01428]